VPISTPADIASKFLVRASNNFSTTFHSRATAANHSVALLALGYRGGAQIDIHLPKLTADGSCVCIAASHTESGKANLFFFRTILFGGSVVDR
jgi:hypothetical protein